MAQQYVRRNGVFVPITDEEHRAEVDPHASYLLADGTRALSGDLSAGGNKVTGLAEASDNGDAVRHEDPRLQGIGGVRIWLPDAPPESPHACDDEMDGSSIDPKWTETDVSTSVTWSMDTDRRMLKAVQTGNGSVRWAFQRQAVPDSEFAIYTKCSTIYPLSSDGMGIGLFVSADMAGGAAATADFRTLEFANATNFAGVQTRSWNQYNGTPSSSTTKNPFPATYLRMRLNGTACDSDCSHDGVSWFTVGSVTLGFTPVYMGIPFLVVGSGIQGTGLVHFFRCFSGAGTSGYNSTAIGRYI